MRINLITLFSIIALSTLSNTAQAQESSRSDRVTEITFEGVDLNGKHHNPAGSLIQETKRPYFNPLINVREHFNQEVFFSLDSI